MINSVSMNSGMSQMATSMQRQPPPPDQDVFQVADSSSEGQVASAGGKAPAGGAPGATGASSDSEEGFDILDVNEDGYVSMEELQGLTASQGYNPAAILNSEDGESGIKPPPPPSTVVTSAYEANSGEDKMGKLLALLQEQTGSDEEYSSLEMTA